MVDVDGAREAGKPGRLPDDAQHQQRRQTSFLLFNASFSELFVFSLLLGPLVGSVDVSNQCWVSSAFF